MNQFQSEDTLVQLPSMLDQINLESIKVEEPDPFEQPIMSGHDENLAEKLSNAVLNRIASDLMSAIESDFLSRKDWEDGLKDGLEQLGLKVDQREFPFNGASGVYSPIMLRTVAEFSATAFPEIFPIGGPVKQIIIGEISQELEEQAERVENWSNLYFTQEAEEFYADQKKMLTWIPWVGTTIRKVYFCPILKRPTSKFIRPQDFVVNYNTNDIMTCWRMTEVLSLNRMELSERMKVGLYRSVSLSADDSEENETTTLKTNLDDAEGITNPNYDREIDYTFYECHTYLDFQDVEGESNFIDENENLEKVNLRPYVVTIHKKTYQIMSIYRNWEEEDKDYNRKDFYVKYGYMEGLGFYNYGAAHLIGGLSQACTALLRQTIDGQTLSNFPGGLYAKGTTRLEDNNIRVGPTEFIPIDTMGMAIQDCVMTMPYKEPSPAINEIRKELENSAAGIMGAANMQIADFSPNVPVGTTYAILGMIHKVQGSVMRGLRDSLSQELKLFYKLFAKHLPDTPYNFDMEGGSSFISRQDFSPKIAMIPIADPYITTDMQRLMRYQISVDDFNIHPNLVNGYIALRNKYRAMKMTDKEIDELLPPPEQVLPLDPGTENQKMMTGKPVQASIDQDHPSHITVHSILLNDPQTPPEVKASAMAHIQWHNALQFQIDMQSMIGFELPEDPSQISMEVQNQIAMKMAEALQNQQQQQQQEAPPPPLDPAVAMLEASKMETEVKSKGIDEKARTDELRVEVEAMKAQLQFEIDQMKLELENRKLDQKESLELHKIHKETDDFNAIS